MRTLAALFAAGLALGGCAHVERASVGPADATAWRSYRTTVVADLDRVLGPTSGLRADCVTMAAHSPRPEFGIDLGKTLSACRRGDTSDARQYAHQQVDHVATNDQAIGLIP